MYNIVNQFLYPIFLLAEKGGLIVNPLVRFSRDGPTMSNDPPLIYQFKYNMSKIEFLAVKDILIDICKVIDVTNG